MHSITHIGTAGWSLPSAMAEEFPREGSHLERYAARFNAVEINSSFHRPHRRSTYERWAASVPEEFRFSLKLPKTITHERRFVECDDLVVRFAEESAGLGRKRGPLLVQLPPSFAFDATVAAPFFDMLAEQLPGRIVCEPRHATWFAGGTDAFLTSRGIARVAADPASSPEAARPGGWRGIAYFRLHGSPNMYRSRYDAAAIDGQARDVRDASVSAAEVWVIYDNTTLGAALPNALGLIERS